MIRFLHFSKRFGAQVAVTDLSLAVGGGEVVALLGPNGSGKTTTLKAAAGLIRPTTGAVLLGEPGRAAHDPAARQTCSFLPQKVSFPDSLTGREVVEFYRELREAAPGRTADVLRFASLNGAGDRPVATYSGGMIQRLGLAVAMLPAAPVLLLDEPMAALDPAGLSAFHDLVAERRRRGLTVFFTSHQLGDVEHLADRFAIMVGGRLVACLAATELSARLADRGLMRLHLGRRPADLLDRLHGLAPGASWQGDELIVPGPAASRLAVLDLVRGSDVEVRSLTTEEGRLDAFYRELVEEDQS